MHKPQSAGSAPATSTVSAASIQHTVGKYRNRGLECLSGNLRMAMRAVTQMYDTHLEPTGLGTSQLAVLWAATALQPVNMSTLSERLALDQTSLSRNVAVLMRRGLLTAAAGADARHKLVAVTPEGAAAFAQAMPYWERAQQAVRAALGARHFVDLVDSTLRASNKVKPGSGSGNRTRTRSPAPVRATSQ